MLTRPIEQAVDSYTTGETPAEWNLDGLRTYFYGTLCHDNDFKLDAEALSALTREELKRDLLERAENLYAEKEKLFGTEQMREVERVVLLKNVDMKWMDHLDAMDDLKGSTDFKPMHREIRSPNTDFKAQICLTKCPPPFARTPFACCFPPHRAKRKSSA